MINVVVEKLMLSTDSGQKAELELKMDGEKIPLKGDAKSPVYAALTALSNYFGYVAYGWNLNTKKQLDGIAATGTVKIIDEKLVNEEIRRDMVEETNEYAYDGTFQGNSQINESKDGIPSLVGYRVVGSAIKAYFNALGLATNKKYNVQVMELQKLR